MLARVEPKHRDPAATAFRLAVAALLLVALLQALAVARAEWFSRDDFAFLLRVQAPWSWRDTFLPLERSAWWAWRPLGMDGFFRLSYRLFGLEPFGYFALQIAVHFALAPAVWALARRIGLARPAATAAGALAVLAPPGLTGLYYASVFHYVAANLLGTLTLVLFLDGRRRGGWPARIASWACFSAGLLCNETLLVVPGVALLLALLGEREGPWPSRIARALAAITPLAALAAVYLVLRFGVIELAHLPRGYRPRFEGNLLRHYWTEPVSLAGGALRLAGALAGMAGVWLFCALRARLHPQPLRRLLRGYALLVPWLLAAIAPFAPLPFSHARFALTLVVPGALLVGAHLDALWRLLAPRRAAALRVAFALLLLLVLPLGAMRARAAHPLSRGARSFVEGIARAYPNPAPGTLLVVVYGGEGLASRHQMETVSRLTWSGIAIRAMRFPQLGVVRFVSLTTARENPCARCLYVSLDRDLEIHRLDPRVLRAGPGR